MEQQAAATKVQAIQRGRVERKQLAEKKVPAAQGTDNAAEQPVHAAESPKAEESAYSNADEDWDDHERTAAHAACFHVRSCERDKINLKRNRSSRRI